MTLTCDQSHNLAVTGFLRAYKACDEDNQKQIRGITDSHELRVDVHFIS